LSTEHIQLSNDNYQNLKESSEKRLDAMLDFITNMLECRSKQLLEYFGEKSQGDVVFVIFVLLRIKLI